MKKALPAFLIFVLTMCLLTSCTLNKPNDRNDNSNPNENEGGDPPEEICDHVLTESIYKEADYGIKGAIYVSCSKCDYSELKEIPALPPAFECTVLDKVAMNDEKGEYIAFDIVLTNTCDFEIDKLSGTLHIVGSKILLLKISFEDLDLAAGQTTELTVYTEHLDNTDPLYSVSKSIFDTPFEKLKFQFETTDISVIK